MPFDLAPDEKAPTGKSLRDVAGAVLEASKIRQPTITKPVSSMSTFTLKSLSSKNQVVQVGSQHIAFDHNGEAKLDVKFRAEAEHHCNLRQGFFHIVENPLPPQVETFLQNSAGDKMTLNLEIEMDDLVNVLANVLSVATEEEKLALVSLTDRDDIMAFLESMLDRQESETARIDGDSLVAALEKGEKFSVDTVLKDVEGASLVTQEPEVSHPADVVSEDTDEQSDDDTAALAFLEAVESGAKVDDNGEVTKVEGEKRGRGRPKSK